MAELYYADILDDLAAGPWDLEIEKDIRGYRTVIYARLVGRPIKDTLEFSHHEVVRADPRPAIWKWLGRLNRSLRDYDNVLWC